MNEPVQQASSHRGVAIAAWIMIGLTCLVALIPGVGFVTWLIGGPVMLISLILGIIVLSKGGTIQGILILLATFIFLPIFLLLTPLVMTGLAAAALEPNHHSLEIKNGESEEREIKRAFKKLEQEEIPDR